jgi:phosphatidylserine/phosphatidylglycerophosphate/cardiolipin synthase-like enzyme
VYHAGVFPVALSLALAALSPTPVASVATGAAIALCFSPEEDCTAFAIHAIDRAEQQILVSTYALTSGSGIVEALVRAKQRGVDVMLIADRTTPCERGSGIEPLARAGVPIRIDRGVRIAHAKAIVIDHKVVLTGSTNWTASAARNFENVAFMSSEAVAAAYTAHWQSGKVASRCRCLSRAAKNGVAAPRWPGSSRKHRRDETGTRRPSRSWRRSPRMLPWKSYSGPRSSGRCRTPCLKGSAVSGGEPLIASAFAFW